MDIPYLDPSRGRQGRTGIFSRILRLCGTALFLTGVAVGCYSGLQWLQTGRADPTLIQDVVTSRLPDGVQGWIAGPRSWYGLHRLALWVLRIPLFASVAFTGFLILLAGTASRRP